MTRPGATLFEGTSKPFTGGDDQDIIEIIQVVDSAFGRVSKGPFLRPAKKDHNRTAP